MIGMTFVHEASGTKGTVDAEVIHPDGSVIVRICDQWFDIQLLRSA
jgi:hypothetical protein